MPENFNTEAQYITEELKQVDGYMACESIIIRNILKHFENGFDEPGVEHYLKKLTLHLGYLIGTCKDNTASINFAFAVGFVNSLLKRPAWKNWVKTIET